MVDRLLTLGANVNAEAATHYGRTALQGAAEQGHLEIVDRLLTSGADVNAEGAIYSGRTAFQGAVEQGHMKVAGRLSMAKRALHQAVLD